MKKIKFMRVAAVLLILCLATTCAISSTFAKYTTEGSATDTARVAKWGVTASVTGDVFAETYAKNDSAFTANANSVVSSETGENVVAPGTSGNLSAITLEGNPEVAVRVEANIDLELVGWEYKENPEATAAMYCPIVFKVGGTAVDVSACTTLDEVEAAVEEAVIKAILGDTVTVADDTTGKKASVDYAANTNLAAGTTAVTWEWAFDGDDAKDTYLGNLETAPTISITTGITVTQID